MIRWMGIGLMETIHMNLIIFNLGLKEKGLSAIEPEGMAIVIHNEFAKLIHTEKVPGILRSFNNCING